MSLPIVSFLRVLTLCLPHTYKFKLSVPKVKNFLKDKSTLKSKPEWVTVLDGSQEGAFQWVSLANLLSFCVYSVASKFLLYQTMEKSKAPSHTNLKLIKQKGTIAWCPQERTPQG